MSRENLELARRLYPGEFDIAEVFGTPRGLAANRRVLEPYVHPDFETIADPNAIPMAGQSTAGDRAGGSVHGVDGFVSVWKEWLTAWDSWVVRPHDFIDVDDERVLVLFEIRGRPKGQRAEVPVEGGNLLTIREGKVTRLELYFDREDALEAAGVEQTRRP